MRFFCVEIGGSLLKITDVSWNTALYSRFY